MIIRLQCSKFCCPRIKPRAKTSGGSLAKICIHYNTNSYSRHAQWRKNTEGGKSDACASSTCIWKCKSSHYYSRLVNHGVIQI